MVGVLLAAFLCMLAWCGSSRPADGSPWTENDFVPYDKNGGPIAVEGSQWALLSYDQAQTARGVTEGMTAKEAVAKYDFFGRDLGTVHQRQEGGQRGGPGRVHAEIPDIDGGG